MYNVLFVITRSVFWEMQDSYLPLWLTLDYLSDVIYIMDMFVSARTGECPSLMETYEGVSKSFEPQAFSPFR